MFALIVKTEQKRILTDAFLLLMIFLTPLIALLLRTYWPVINASYPQWNIEQYQPAMSVLIALLTPMMLGLVLGFNLLADREQGMLTVVRTTPAGLGKYLLVRSSGYFAISLILTPLLHELLGFVALPLITLLSISLLAQILLPMSALILLNFGTNLVEGFAIMKGTGGLVSIPIVMAMFVPAPWYWLAAPLPTWWTLWGYFELAAGDSLGLAWLTLGALMQMAITYWLWVRLMNKPN